MDTSGARKIWVLIHNHTGYGAIMVTSGRFINPLSANLAEMKGVRVMYKRTTRSCCISLIMLIVAFTFSSCTTTGSAVKGEAGPGELSQNITYDVPASAQIAKVAYFYKMYKNQSRLHFSVSIKNVTKEPKRYRLNLLLPEGPAVGGMYPRKAKAIEPGETLERTFPVYIDLKKLPADFLPTGFTLMVKEL